MITIVGTGGCLTCDSDPMIDFDDRDLVSHCGAEAPQLRGLFFDCHTLCGTMYDMAARLNEPTERRTPLPLTARDLADLGKLREPGPEREALSALAAALPEGDVSEALLVHAVFVAGLRAVREAAEA